jgi:hypothetical protein
MIDLFFARLRRRGGEGGGGGGCLEEGGTGAAHGSLRHTIAEG